MIIIVCFLVATLMSLKYVTKNNDYLSKEISTAVKGICCIIILINHVFMKKYLFLQFFYESSYLCVALFYFYSAYGLMYQKHNDINYFKDFFKKRILKLLIPFWGISGIYLLKSILIDNENFTAFHILQYMTGIKLINPILWYVVSIFIFYLVFYYTNKFFNDFWALVSFSIFLLAYIGFGVFMDIGVWWYISSGAFVLGLFWNIYEKSINHYINEYYKTLLSIMLPLFTVFYVALIYFSETISVFTNLPSNYIVVALQISSVPFFIVLLLLLLRKITFRFKTFAALGRISYEIYLIHPLMINLLGRLDFIKENNIFLLLVILITCVVAFLLHQLGNIIYFTCIKKTKITENQS